jgi:hypothetical protein
MTDQTLRPRVTLGRPVTAAVVSAAREALNTFVALENSEDHEPLSTAPNGDWDDWHRESYRPALRRWTRAMDQLEALLGEDFPGRECRSWVIVCVRVLSGELR